MATAKEPTRPSETDPLNSFLGGVESFVAQITAEIRKAAPEGDQQAMIAATGDSLIGQTTKLTAFVRESASRLSTPQRSELNRFLQVQDGEAQANRVVEVTKQVLAKGLLGNLMHWISQHLKELKKVLSEILHFIFDLLHIPYPDWLDTILRILDELLDLLLSLLADVFGIDFGRTARQLSEQEVNFLRETAAFEAIRVVRAGRRAPTPEEA
jgi:hypothetical protein